MREKLEKIKADALGLINAAKDSSELDALKVKYLGKKSELATALRSMGQLTAEERPIIGQLANEIRGNIEEAVDKVSALIKEKEEQAKIEKERIDVTPPLDRDSRWDARTR